MSRAAERELELLGREIDEAELEGRYEDAAAARQEARLVERELAEMDHWAEEGAERGWL